MDKEKLYAEIGRLALEKDRAEVFIRGAIERIRVLQKKIYDVEQKKQDSPQIPRAPGNLNPSTQILHNKKEKRPPKVENK